MPLDRGTNIYTDPEEDLGSIPYSETPEGIVKSLYTSVLGRAPDQGGLDYWTDLYSRGILSLPDITKYFQDSAEIAPMFQGGFDVNKDRNISAEERQAYLNSLLAAQDTPAGAGANAGAGAGANAQRAIDASQNPPAPTTLPADTTLAARTYNGVVYNTVAEADAQRALDIAKNAGSSSDPTLVARTYNGVVYNTVAEADAARAAAAGRSGDTRLGGEDTLAGGEDTLAGGEDTLAGGEDTLAGGEDTLAGGNSTVGGGNSTVGGGNSTVGGGNSTVGGGAYTPRGLSALTPLPTSTVTSRDVITSFQPERAPAKLAGPMAAPSTLRRAGDQPYYNMYQEVLGRIPEAEALAYWKSQFGDEISPSERAAFRAAAQGEIDTNFENMYQNVLGRASDPTGLAYWKAQFGDRIDPSELAAFTRAAQPEITSRPVTAPAYTGPSLTYASQGFNAPVASGLSQALSSGMTKDQYLANVKNYLDSGVVPGQILSDMTKYGITTDDLIGAKYASTLASTGTSTGGAGAGGAPPAGGGTSEPVQGGKTGGAVIRLAEGGEPMTKYTLPDFGLTPATSKGVFNYERDVVFNPEFAKLEAIERARLANDPREQARLERDRLMKFGLITSPAEEIASRYWNDRFLSQIDYANEGDKKYYESFDYDKNRRISPEEHQAYLNSIRGMKEGGVAKGLGSIAMKGYAEEMAQKGRFGDTMLAHISPEEAQMLQAAGGAGTINPHTGLPEYFSWRKILKPIAKILPFVLPFTGVGLPLQALISGVAGGLGGEKGFDFKRGLMSGLMSYGMGSLAQGAGQAGGLPTTDPSMAAGQSLSGEIAAPTVGEAPKFGNIFTSDKGVLSQLGENVQAVGQGAMGAATGAPGAREAFTAGQGSVFGKTLTPTMAAGATAVGMGGVKAADEMNQFELQQAMANAKTEEEREKYKQLFLRTLGQVYAGGGGISALAAGGASGPPNQPRTINGAGDGMSDSVPATIEGIQEARLADGEFVIPADVVADLGNGSSNAGSKKLYAMMDRVREARHGTTKQPPEINMGRLMPA